MVPSDAPDPTKLTDYLFLGSVGAAQDEDQLRDLGISHVVNCANDVECLFPQSFKYLHCEIEDGGDDDSIVDHFKSATDFVETARSSGGIVLVHCMMGINRSATVALAVLMNLEDWTLKRAFEHVHHCRSCVDPFQGNRQKIAAWELQTHSTCSMPDWLSP
eukprot:gnl/MRDRNA2_/MRDRNA2_107355_c0_seq1.p1 gnl/MRDRNA2_/MRDRNA2_107355_c0~~gnl/MRDRNA2_/MRDRNA2_107355_c0_seq1.p1  ORF type:complete len:161 (+),score=34.26 gnl/MRDRNA2_/MRDRNA2_107355_c0_seq1:85-567(+)